MEQHLYESLSNEENGRTSETSAASSRNHVDLSTREFCSPQRNDGQPLTANPEEQVVARFGKYELASHQVLQEYPLSFIGERPLILRGSRVSLIDTRSPYTILAPERVVGLTEEELIQGQILRKFWQRSGDLEQILIPSHSLDQDPDTRSLGTSAYHTYAFLRELQLDDFVVPAELQRLTYEIGKDGSATGTRIDGIIGMEELRSLCVLFDSTNKTVAILKNNLPIPGRAIPLEDGFRDIVVKISDGSRPLFARVATSSRYSYLPGNLFGSGASLNDPLRDIDDSYKGITTMGYRTRIKVGGIPLSTTVGLLPRARREQALDGCDALIGAEILKLAPQVIFDFPRRRIILPER